MYFVLHQCDIFFLQELKLDMNKSVVCYSHFRVCDNDI